MNHNPFPPVPEGSNISQQSFDMAIALSVAMQQQQAHVIHLKKKDGTGVDCLCIIYHSYTNTGELVQSVIPVAQMFHTFDDFETPEGAVYIPPGTSGNYN